MRIAWFTHRYHPCLGGAEAYGRAMVRRFVAAGHEVDVFTSDAHELWYFTDRTKRRVEAPAESVVDGARVRRFAVRHIPFQKYVGRLLSYVPHWPTQCRWESYMPIIPGLERVRGDYDAAFAVGFPFTVFSYAALRTARAAGAPLVLTPFLHLATPGDAVNRHYTRPHQVRLLSEADLVVTPTSLEARAIASWGIDAGRIQTIPMAIERSDVTGGDGMRLRSRLGISGGAPLVGQLGALDPNKGTPDLVRAVARLNESRPGNRPVHLALAGAPSPSFDAFVAGLGPSASRWLHVLGPLPPADVPDFYDALDLFAMPSRTDSFGIVYLEAWANGKPVVAASAGGVVEVVRHQHNGLLVPFGDVDALARSLDRLLSDLPLARRLGEAGRAEVLREDATWDARFDTLLGRVRGLVDARGKGGPRRPGAPRTSRDGRGPGVARAGGGRTSVSA
jgi:glycosyltransferase involved in cell wall biosynthesis